MSDTTGVPAPAPLPKAPPEEDAKDGCCGICGSLFHSTADHPPAVTVPASPTGFVVAAAEDELPPGYDPGEADRLIGRDPSA